MRTVATWVLDLLLFVCWPAERWMARGNPPDEEEETP